MYDEIVAIPTASIKERFPVIIRLHYPINDLSSTPSFLLGVGEKVPFSFRTSLPFPSKNSILRGVLTINRDSPLDSVHFSIAISSNRIVAGDAILPGAVLVDDGIITDIVPLSAIPLKYTREDCGDFVIMPGLVDTHVHINEPGRTEWEGFETATRSACAGGVTSLVEMPLNASPVTTTREAFQKKLDASNGKLMVDCGFHGGLIPGNAGAMGSLIEAGVLGIKAFLVDSGIDEFPPATEQDLRTAMPVLAGAGVPLLVHAEVEVPDRPVVKGSRRYHDYLASRPANMEQRAIELMISLCREYKCRTHIVHLSSADAVPALRRAKEEGLPLTVETCPHYLVFDAEEIADGDTRFKCAPPIREKENRERLWDALREGVIDLIASDHSPCPPSMKETASGDFQKAWGGIASLQFGLPAVWTEASKRGFSLTKIADWMSLQPARLVGLEHRKGVLLPGADADLVVWDPDGRFVIREQTILHRHKITPYDGRTLKGTVQMTFLRGRKVYDRGNFAAPAGTALMRDHVDREGIWNR